MLLCAAAAFSSCINYVRPRSHRTRRHGNCCSGICQWSPRPLQQNFVWHQWSVSETASTGSKRCISTQTEAQRLDHIRPTLRELHWIPVTERKLFKVGVLTYKCHHNLAPPNLAEMVQPVSPRNECSHLRSAASNKHLVPRTKMHYVNNNNIFIAANGWIHTMVNAVSWSAEEPEQ